MDFISKTANFSWVKGSISTGITICLGNSDEESYVDFLQFEKKKQQINIIKKSEKSIPINSLKNEISTKHPIFLNIIGKGILHKKIKNSNISQLNDDELIKSVLPNIQASEFYIQKIYNSIDLYVVIIRKALMESIIENISNQGFEILEVFIGITSLVNILDLSSHENYVICDLSIHLKDKQIDTIEAINENKITEYIIGDEVINGKNILSFSSALTFYSVKLLANSLSPSSILRQQNFIYKKFYTYLKWFLLIGTFIILLINYLLYSYFSTQNNKLTSEFNSTLTELEVIKQLTDNVTQKEKFLKDNNITNPTHFSLFADRIALIRPNGIVFTRLKFNPLRGDIRNQNRIEFELNKMIIEGSSDKISTLNNWLKDIEKEKWVKKVELIDFNQEDISISANFTIDIYF